MHHNYATAQRDGYTVPLIGISNNAQLERCDLCGDEFPMSQVDLNGTQMLCTKCRTK